MALIGPKIKSLVDQVMMRSKICPKICVGTDTCCERPKVSNNSLNVTDSLLCTKSMWRLKSLVGILLKYFHQKLLQFE